MARSRWGGCNLPFLARPAAREAAREAALARSPVVAVLGPRSCGNTTLARQLVPEQTPFGIGATMPLSAPGIGPASA